MASSINLQNLAAATKYDILATAEQMQKDLEQVKARLDQMSPTEQAQHVQSLLEGDEFSQNSETVKTLQIRVESTYCSGIVAIPKISDDELGIISKKLRTSRDLRDSIIENGNLAKEISELSLKVQRALSASNINPAVVRTLQDRVTELRSIDKINTGNRAALEEMLATISRATVPAGQFNQTTFSKMEGLDDLEEWLFIRNRIIQIKTSNEISPEKKKKFFEDMLAILNQVPGVDEKSEETKRQPSAAKSSIVESPSAVGTKQTIPFDERYRSSSISVIDAIKDLQALLPLFQEGASNQNFQDALQKLAVLESSAVNLPFKISNNALLNIANRPCFHLYYIHKNESPQKLKSDPNYGYTAMVETYPTNNAERTRAIKRTIAEVVLQRAEDSVHSNQHTDLLEALNILEGLQMSANDMPSEQNNLAHILFDKMYHKHVEARKINSTLVDPSDWKFKGDFGRNAFTTVNGINSADKIAVIDELLLTLKNIWKIV
jgi:hypothetical protein